MPSALSAPASAQATLSAPGPAPTVSSSGAGSTGSQTSSPTSRPPTAGSPSTTSRTSASTSASTSTSTLTRQLPRASNPRQGGTYWAVIAGVSTDPQDRGLLAAVNRLRAMGYPRPEQSDLDCLQGAREALGLEDESLYASVAVLFARRPDADRVAAALQSPSARVAEVKTFCLD